ncbi:MAG: carboxypeptidase-like regulatory domain-containing protein [Bacteroidota bacterium]
MINISKMSSINKYVILSILTIITCWSCEEISIIPAQGTIEGIVVDNNGLPQAGVQVSATFEPPTQGGEPFPKTETTTTDAIGFYRFSELWDEVSISIDQPGFHPYISSIDLGKGRNQVLNPILEGSPIIVRVDLNKTTLNTGSLDTINIDIEVMDVFNSQAGNYIGNILVQNTNGGTQAIIPASTIASSQQKFLLKTQITSDLLPIGTFSLLAEVSDPDGNTDQSQLEQRISIQ